MRSDPNGLKSEVMISTKFPIRAGLPRVKQRFLPSRYLSPICPREQTFSAEGTRGRQCDGS
jgi:hypothetical protein